MSTQTKNGLSFIVFDRRCWRWLTLHGRPNLSNSAPGLSICVVLIVQMNLRLPGYSSATS